MPDNKDHVLAALRAQFGIEEGRAQGLNTRGASLAGLGSIVLSLLTFVVSSEFRAGAEVPNSAKYLVVGALGVLVAAVALVVIAVVRPREPNDYVEDELFNLANGTTDARSTLINRLNEALKRHREINDSKAFWLTVAGALVTFAVLLSAIAGAVIAL